MEDFLQDIKIPELDEIAREAVFAQWAKMGSTADSLGELANMVAQLAAMTGKEPQIVKKAMILATADHGVAVHGVSNFPQEVTVQMIQGYLRGTAGANVMANHADITYNDLFVVDVGVKVDLPAHPRLINKKIAYGTADFTQGAAMSREDAVKSLKVGFEIANECIDQGYGMLVLSEMGIGNTTASAAIASVFTGLPPEKTVGRGTGIGDKRLGVKQRVVEKALQVNKPDSSDAIGVLAKVGGYELGALAGVVIAGAARRVPIFVDGVNATAAALLAYGIFPQTSSYMLGSHLSAEIAHPAMLKLMGIKPVLTANMRLGEGTGASLVMYMLDGAIEVFNKS